MNLIKKGGEKYGSLDEYVNWLMQAFDANKDGLISAEELADGLRSMNINISPKEKLALMKRLDRDRDGNVSREELYEALNAPDKKPIRVARKHEGVGYSLQSQASIELILKKIRKAVAHYASMQEQVIALMKIFDKDSDGMVSFLELTEGIKSMGIQAKKSELIEIMNRIDADRDGFITQSELYSALDLKPKHAEY